MTARRKARKRALDLLFEAEQRSIEPLGLLADRRLGAAPAVPAYAVELVEGVEAHRAEIDTLLGSALAGGWTLDRLPAVDRTVLRIAVYELRYRTDVPAGVAISEAVGLVADLSTDDSPGYVNGVLGAVSLALTTAAARATPR